jgi:hypothetical protein
LDGLALDLYFLDEAEEITPTMPWQNTSRKGTYLTYNDF